MRQKCDPEYSDLESVHLESGEAKPDQPDAEGGWLFLDPDGRIA
jgi:hypothetical protein